MRRVTHLTETPRLTIVTVGRLIPVRLLDHLRTSNVLIDPPLARRPLNDLIGRTREITIDPTELRPITARVRIRTAALVAVRRIVLRTNLTPQDVTRDAHSAPDGNAAPTGNVTNLPDDDGGGQEPAEQESGGAGGAGTGLRFTEPGTHPTASAIRATLEPLLVNADRHTSPFFVDKPTSAEFARADPGQKLSTDVFGLGASQGHAVT